MATAPKTLQPRIANIGRGPEFAGTATQQKGQNPIQQVLLQTF